MKYQPNIKKRKMEKKKPTNFIVKMFSIDKARDRARERDGSDHRCWMVKLQNFENKEL